MRVIDADALLERVDEIIGNTYDEKTAAIIHAIQYAPAFQVVPLKCYQCKYWDTESGLTARKCKKHDRITTRYGYCSEGRVREQGRESK